MLKEVKEFFTGGEQLREAKAQITRLEAKSRLSNREEDKLTQAQRISRRHLLKLAATGIGIAVVGGVTGELIDWIVSSDGQKETDGNSEADTIRQQIKQYESQHYGEVTEETTKQLSQFISDLYNQTYGKKPIQNKTLVIDNSYLRSKGQPETQVPMGDAGVVVLYQDTNSGKINQIIPIIIFAGKPEASDPTINKLSVFRALIEHEFSHAQTKVTPETESVTVTGRTFKADRRRGFKWVDITFGDGDHTDEFCHFFDEVNTQLLAEYLNDPTNQDSIFRQMNASPVYKHSLATTYVEGAKHLRRIYQRLGISATDLEKLHYEAQPKKLLDLIDQKVQILGVRLTEPASTTLANLNPGGNNDIVEIAPLANLADSISKQTNG